ncbi:phosphatase 2C-like domain-containing protein [Mycena pura]|uniref:Phosphatase 2C-like domain-containing protein n=1 Tax=Mycena pura TaxID=153505 RepID=A0AAD6YK68_9AGAR|nr:phosphatase 2C-like domain-containing protein [Mycena pura]
MASRFTSFARIRAISPTSRLVLGFSGTLGLYYTSKLRGIHADANATSMRVERSNVRPQKGIYRVDSVCWPANFPCEDHLSSLFINPFAWSFWSVYDGHVGPQAARHLDTHLLPNLVEKLADLYTQKKNPEKDSIHSIIKNVFLDLDDEMVNKSAQFLRDQPEGAPIKSMAASVLQAALSGSCALVAFYEANLRRLHVSVVGDSRAVLGRRRQTADGKTVYDVRVLSVDQTAKNPAEVARVTAAHPDEPQLADTQRGRFLGWGITRAFGNGVMKWSRELQTWMADNVLGDRPRETCKTPPYFTAEPEITTTDVQPGDFMIMASDGLWDCLSNEEAVGLVGLWLERKGNSNSSNSFWDAGLDFFSEENVVDRGELPVELKDEVTHYRRSWNAQKQFVNVDLNVARHLARNALGGASKDLHVALMSTPAPRARHIRDDISAVVVFFE